MKAEPESRLEKGKDIKFSIDDLAAKTEPEPWDGKSINSLEFIAQKTKFSVGIRAYPGRSKTKIPLIAASR
jgi:hypothetical protein